MTDETAPPGARVGVRDVARVAGVSTQTVSRVLNGHPHIREETRGRVMEAIAALDYRVNNAARALGTRETRTIGVVASDAALYGPAAGIAALESAARSLGRWVATTYADAGDERSILEALAHVLGQGVDGIVLVALRTRTLRLIQERAGGTRVAPLHGEQGELAQRSAAAAVVEHLASLGHQRLARLGGPPEWPEEEARRAGFDDAVAAHRLAAPSRWTGDWSAASGAAAASEIAARVRADGGPTAVVVANDQMALGLMAGLQALGVQVPRDVSVAGFDDNPDAAFYGPALTTVRLDIAGEARRCVHEVLAGRRSDVVPPAPPQPVQPPALILRASTAPPA